MAEAVTAHDAGVARPARPTGADGAVLAVWRAERRKLLAQLSTRVLVLVCLLGPFAFAAILDQQNGVPADTLLGVWVHTSGYAVAFVVLGFAGFWGFPVLAGVLAGDMFSSEDRYGTWKTVLTRSATRRELFIGKIITAAIFSAALVALAALSSLASGLLLTGSHPLVGLGGNVLTPGECLLLVLVSWLLSILPMLAFTSLALLFSVATRNGIVGVLGPVLVGLAMQLLALVGSGAWVHMLLVASAFDDWHGLLAAHRFYGPLVIGSAVSALWALACLGTAWLILRRRDFAGAPIARHPGWVVPLRAVLASAAVIVALGALSDLGPAAITKARLEASITPAFNDLTVLQQRQLGRVVASGAVLEDRTSCRRRAGTSKGPGDDWSCTLTVATPQLGANPLQITPVTYDVSVKSNGCYKAQAPPSFVGQQTMTDARGHSIVNPLFTIYGCFDTTGGASGCNEVASCSSSALTSGAAGATPGAHAPTPARTRGNQAPGTRGHGGYGPHVETPAQRKAEKVAGPRVMKEIEEAEKREERAAEKPAEEAPTYTAGK